MRFVLRLAPVAALAFLPLGVAAQTPDQLSTVANALEWREIGPTIMGGRISDLAVVESDPSVFFVGTATGGVWKTENAGITFEPIFDGEVTASVGDVTVAPSNPNVIWVGTGEPQNRQSSPWGNGVYRSTDAGQSWTHLGLENTHHISRIQVHPRNPDVAYVAAMGHLWGSNSERGVYRTMDGGQSWDRVLFVDAHTGTIDLAMDPSDPQTLFAAMYQRQRKAWGYNGGGPGSGIYRSTDGGHNWVELTEGLPEGDKGRIGLDIYRGDGNLICALVEADARVPGQGFGGGSEDDVENGVYCSTDRGDTWEHRSTTNNRPMYYSQIRIDPNDPERMYLGGSDLFRTSDGGRTFTNDAADGVHLDHHALWINPENSDHLILGSDGGVSISWDRSDNWYQFRNLPLGQFYEIGVDMREPYHVCGGLQDNGSWCAPSDTRSNQGIRTRDWYNVNGGDGFFTVMHPSNPALMFAESQGGNLTRVNLETMERTRMRPIGRPGADAEMPDLRWNWDTPIVLSAHDDNTIYTGSNVLFRSTDLGQTFEAISGDLTWAIDRDTLMIMGVPGGEAQMSRNDGQSSYGNLTAIAESPRDASVIYTGADDGRLQVTQDGGATWTDLTQRVDELPEHSYVTRIVASHGAPGTVFAAFDNHRNDDFNAYVYRSENFGQDWIRITNGLPVSSMSALAQHPDNANLLFAGNEIGVYASADAGANWVRLHNGLPTVPVDDIKIHPRENDLVIGTHGRGIWILDDISPLEHLNAGVVASNAHIFPIRRATSYNLYTPQGWTPGIFAAPNPPAGARIRYHLTADTEDLELRVTDATGALVRALDAPSTAGMHEVIWDLRIEATGADGEATGTGPRVLAGAYIVEMTTGADVVQSEVSVRMDPRINLGRRDLMVRHQSMMESYRLSHVVDAAEDALGEMDDHLDEVHELLEDRAPDGLAAAVAALRETLEVLGDDLDDASDGASAWRGIEGSGSMPTSDALFQIDRSWEDLPGVIDRINGVMEDFNRVMGQVYAPAAMPEGPTSITVPSRGG
jgi:photosystem II stability/assembly factor-like uncharacterized protein